MALEMEVDASNLSANIGFRPASVDIKKAGKRPGSGVINDFYNFFDIEVQRLRNLAREPKPDFDDEGESRRIKELENDKIFLQQQMAAINSNHTKLTDSHAQLITSHNELISTHGELSKAYVELTTRENPQREGG